MRDLWSFLGVSRDAALHDLAPLNQAPASFDSALLQRSSGLLIRSGLSAWLPPRLRAAGRALFSRERAAPVVRPPLAPATRARLVEYYREPNRELGELLGRSLASWGA